MIDLSNRVALVTGASRGIGRAIAARLAAQGAQVVAAARAENARATAEEISASGGRCEAVALEEVILCATAPADTAARLSRLSGLPVEPDPAGGFLLRLPGAARAAGPFAPVMETRVRVLTQQALGEVLPGVTTPALPFMAGMVVRTEDGGAAARRVLDGIPTVEAPAGVMVPPAYAAGAAVVFA